MKKQIFKGPMGKYMEQHLALRRSLGFIYRVGYTLNAFDQHLANHFPDCQTITRERGSSVILILRIITSLQPGLIKSIFCDNFVVLCFSSILRLIFRKKAW